MPLTPPLAKTWSANFNRLQLYHNYFYCKFLSFPVDYPHVLVQLNADLSELNIKLDGLGKREVICRMQKNDTKKYKIDLNKYRYVYLGYLAGNVFFQRLIPTEALTTGHFQVGGAAYDSILYVTSATAYFDIAANTVSLGFVQNYNIEFSELSVEGVF